MVFVTGSGALFSEKLLVPNDPAATAANILANPTALYLGWTANLIATICYIVVTALFYEIFAPVNRSVSRVAAFFSLVGCATGAASGALRIAPLAILKAGPSLHAFSDDQLRALAYLLLKTGGQTGTLAFFGCYCLLIGYLILRSTFLPKFLGVFMIFAACGWLTFLWPPLAHALTPLNMAPGVIGEALLTFWLLIAGVNEERWKEAAA